jgi:hypothetical protein
MSPGESRSPSPGRPTRRGRALSIEDYERLEALEDAYWAERAAAAERDGLIGAEEGERLLSEPLNAQV